MIDGIRDLLQNGKPIVVESDNWRGVEEELREEGIRFWGWDRFESDDGGDCIGVNVPAADHERAMEIAGMTGSNDSLWGYFGKALIAAVLLALLALLAAVALGGAL